MNSFFERASRPPFAGVSRSANNKRCGLRKYRIPIFPKTTLFVGGRPGHPSERGPRSALKNGPRGPRHAPFPPELNGKKKLAQPSSPRLLIALRQAHRTRDRQHDEHSTDQVGAGKAFAPPPAARRAPSAVQTLTLRARESPASPCPSLFRRFSPSRGHCREKIRSS